MPITSDANNWWEAPNSSMPQQGFGIAPPAIEEDWFHIGPLTAGQPARVTILPDYFVPFVSGQSVLGDVGLMSETLVSGAVLYQRITITGDYVGAINAHGLINMDIFNHAGDRLALVGSAITLPDQVLQQAYPGALSSQYTFLQVTATVPAARTVTHTDPEPFRSYSVTWYNDFYLEVVPGQNLFGSPGTIGRYLVTTGNPTGQRDAIWGDWLDNWDIAGGPIVTPPPPPPPPPSTDLDPQNLPPTITFSETADHHGVETPPIASVVDASWWQNFGKTALLGYSSIALDALKTLADSAGRPNVGAALNIVNAATTAEGVRDFLHGLVAKIWAHVSEGITLAIHANANPNPSAYAAEIADWNGRGEQINQDAEQQPIDVSVSTVLNRIVNGLGTVWSEFRSIPYSASQKNSFSLGLEVPGLQIQGGDTSDVLFGGNGADSMQLGAGTDFASGLDGNDVISGDDGNDWIFGGIGNDSLSGGAGHDTLDGGAGTDTLNGGLGNDVLHGGDGVDTAVFSGAMASYSLGTRGSALIVSGPDGGDVLDGIENLTFGSSAPVAVSSLSLGATSVPLITVTRSGVSGYEVATPFSGTPIAGIQIDYQFLGAAVGEVAMGTDANDFFNLLGGDDAAAGGAGNDILDGGIGSNFLNGNEGTDTFFLDGRGGTVTWSTITDWTAREQLSVWGWNANSRVVVWRDDGAAGYTGITMHADLNNDGTIDTSVTWTGKTQADLPTPGQFATQELLWFT